jgi:hypothetical protein
MFLLSHLGSYKYTKKASKYIYIYIQKKVDVNQVAYYNIVTTRIDIF